ncbi:MAG: hypothetical protein AB1546_04035 [bacterium]
MGLTVALYVEIGRFFCKVKIKEKTYYAITNKRIIIVKYSRKKEIISLLIKDIPSIEMHVGKNGFGTIVFGHLSFPETWYVNKGYEPFISKHRFFYRETPAFYDIVDAEKVNSIISGVRNKEITET